MFSGFLSFYYLQGYNGLADDIKSLKRIQVYFEKMTAINTKVAPFNGVGLNLVIPSLGIFYARNHIGELIWMMVSLFRVETRFLGNDLILFLTGIEDMIPDYNLTNLRVSQADQARKYVEKMKQEAGPFSPDNPDKDFEVYRG